MRPKFSSVATRAIRTLCLSLILALLAGSNTGHADTPSVMGVLERDGSLVKGDRISVAAAEAILRSVYGKSTRLVITSANKSKPITAKTSFEIVKSNKTQKRPLGKLRFEQLLISAHVVQSAIRLDKSQVQFANYSGDDKANNKLWSMGYGGRITVRQHTSTTKAVNDVFGKNSSKYAFECATAAHLIYLNAIKDRIGAKKFDSAAPRLSVFRWDAPKKTGQDLIDGTGRGGPLRLSSKGPFAKEVWPGDRVYFNNPHFEPSFTAGQGENTIFLGDGRYFGHGLGIKSKEQIVKKLNNLRKPGATKKAYMATKDNWRLSGTKLSEIRPAVIPKPGGFKLKPLPKKVVVSKTRTTRTTRARTRTTTPRAPTRQRVAAQPRVRAGR
jgi:hypothetical protein